MSAGELLFKTVNPLRQLSYAVLKFLEISLVRHGRYLTAKAGLGKGFLEGAA